MSDNVVEFKKIYRQFFPFGDPGQFADYVFNVCLRVGVGVVSIAGFNAYGLLHHLHPDA